MKYCNKKLFFKIFPLLFILFGCGGSNSGGNAPDINSQILGVASDATIVGGTVTLYQYDTGQKGAILASTQTDLQGQFSVQLKGYFGAVLFEITGGDYVDDSTGRPVHILPNQYLSTVREIIPGENIGALAITPLTTIASALASARMKQGEPVNLAIYNANNAVSNFYGFDILHTVPANLTSGRSAYSLGTAYGLVLGAISQMAGQISASNGLGANNLTSIQLTDLMAQDALDGILDGKQGGQQISSGTYLLDSYNYRSKLSQAAALFLLNARNLSGLTWSDMVGLLAPIANSTNPLFPITDLPKPIDNTAPQVTFTVTYPTSSPNIFIVTAQAIDDISGVGSLTVSLVAPAGVNIPPIQGPPGLTSSAAVALDFTTMPDGKYTFTAYSIDNAGNRVEISISYNNVYHNCQTVVCRIIA